MTRRATLRVSAILTALSLPVGLAACGTQVDSPSGASTQGISSSETTTDVSSSETTNEEGQVFESSETAIDPSPPETTNEEGEVFESSERPPGTTNEEGDVLEAHGTEYDDFSNPDTWAKWASYVAVVHVDSEEEQPLQTITGTTEAPVVLPDSLRNLTVTVEDLVWVHPGALLELEEGETYVLPSVLGWLHEGDQKIPLKPQHQDRMEVGQRYVVVLSDTVDENGNQILGPLRAYRLDGALIDSQDSPLGLVTLDAIVPRLGVPTDAELFPVPGESLGKRILRTGEGWLG